MFLLLIPAVAPLVFLAGSYLSSVVPTMFRSGSEPWRVLRWRSSWWWNENVSSSHGIEFLLAACTLAFLVGCIVALVLHLFLPRRSGPGRQSDDL